jgi:abhydrolase domain-containing protein 17
MKPAIPSTLTPQTLRKLLIGEFSWGRLLRSTLLIYAFFALYVFFRADSMMFRPQPTSYQDTPEILKLTVTTTEKISAIHLPNSQAKYTILYSHGNAEDLGVARPMLNRLQNWGFSVFAYDYRGYGTSDGNPSEANAYQDAEAAYTYLTQQLKIPPQRILLYGRSIGSGAAVELATRHPVGGLILESAFTSVFRVVVPFPLLPFDKFSNLDKLPNVRCPVLVLHGKADTVIPIDHGYTLYAAAPQPKRSLWIEGAGHNDFSWVAGTAHQRSLADFQTMIEQQ